MKDAVASNPYPPNHPDNVVRMASDLRHCDKLKGHACTHRFLHHNDEAYFGALKDSAQHLRLYIKGFRLGKRRLPKTAATASDRLSRVGEEPERYDKRTAPN